MILPESYIETLNAWFLLTVAFNDFCIHLQFLLTAFSCVSLRGPIYQSKVGFFPNFILFEIDDGYNLTSRKAM